MKKLIIATLLIALLAGCATARVAGKIGDDMKADRETVESVSDKEWSEAAVEWFDVLLGIIEGATGI